MNPASTNSTGNVVAPTEDDLMGCLTRQEKHYAAATALIAELKQQGESGLQSGLTSLQKHLANIRSSGGEVQIAATAHEATGLPKSALLSAALAGQEQRLKSFLDTINGLQSDFEAMKQRLQPKMDSDVTRRSMQQAYQRSMRTG